MNSGTAVRLFSKEKGRFYFVASVISTVLVISAPSYVFSRTWHINPGGSGDAPTIQAAITLATANDTVLLAPGTYTGPGNRDVNFLRKAVVVRSEGGPSVTIIDCQGLGRGFKFVSGEQRTSVLTGLTITNGSAQRGGAIYCDMSHPRIRGNVITANSADYGGGICLDNPVGSPITDNVITHNAAKYGGGVYCGTWSLPQLVGNVISENTAQFRGGGICADDASDLTITENKISNNSAQDGGGVYCTHGDPVISGNEICGNTAVLRGGGVSLQSLYVSMDHNVIWDNTASVGAGMYGSDVLGRTISNTTIVENHGNAIYVYQSKPRFERTICAFNEGTGLWCAGIIPSFVPTFVCTDVFGNAGGNEICGIDGGGNIHADPQFCGAPADRAYFLHASSPCAPENNSCAALVGAFPVGCEAPPVLPMVRCPGDSIVPAFSTVPLLVLHGFTITNLDAEPRSYGYYLTSDGPATLVDNGNPASLAGVTPVLGPLEEYSPPPAALAVPEITTYCDQTVTYLAIGLWNPSPTDTCFTTVTFEPPVPVFVRNFSGESVDEGVQLTWNVIADDAVSGFRIYRAGSGSGEKDLIVRAGALSRETRTYLDTEVEAGRVYVYELVVVLEDGGEIRSQTLSVETKSYELTLCQNTPNPFNPTTTISFTLPERMRVTLSIYDVQGTLVRALVDETAVEGYQERMWDGKDASGRQVSSGVYFYRLTAGNKTLTKRMVLLR